MKKAILACFIVLLAACGSSGGSGSPVTVGHLGYEGPALVAGGTVDMVVVSGVSLYALNYSISNAAAPQVRARRA
jgi:hypothetical protein